MTNMRKRVIKTLPVGGFFFFFFDISFSELEILWKNEIAQQGFFSDCKLPDPMRLTVSAVYVPRALATFTLSSYKEDVHCLSGRNGLAFNSPNLLLTQVEAGRENSIFSMARSLWGMFLNIWFALQIWPHTYTLLGNLIFLGKTMTEKLIKSHYLQPSVSSQNLT